MKIKEWLAQLENRLEKEELGHLEVHRAKIALQLKNTANGEIELHAFDYVSKNAEKLSLKIE